MRLVRKGTASDSTRGEVIEAFESRQAEDSDRQREGGSADKIDGRWANTYNTSKHYEERR